MVSSELLELCGSIRKQAQQLGKEVSDRANEEVVSNMNKEEAMQVFDGTMLGDNSLVCLGGSAQMRMAKSGVQYMPYLAYLRDTLGFLGVKFCTDHPKNSERTFRSKPYIYCNLESRLSSFLLEQRHRWYPVGKKIVPDDVRITPVSMAYLFMDDGSTTWYGNSVRLKLYTNGFPKEDVYRLRDLVEVRMGTRFLPYPVSKARPHQIVLWLRKKGGVNLFLDQVEPYIHPSYRYKIKRPR